MNQDNAKVSAEVQALAAEHGIDLQKVELTAETLDRVTGAGKPVPVPVPFFGFPRVPFRWF